MIFDERKYKQIKTLPKLNNLKLFARFRELLGAIRSNLNSQLICYNYNNLLTS